MHSSSMYPFILGANVSLEKILAHKNFYLKNEKNIFFNAHVVNETNGSHNSSLKQFDVVLY